AITAFLTGGFIVIDRYMRAWPVYTQSSYINGRPIGTVGAVTPNLAEATSSFWILSLDSLTHLLLPTISLMLISLAAYSRYSRANLLDVMNQDYIRTARAKGVNERTVVMRHAFRNALIPLTTIVAFDVGGLIGGAIITETVFAWKGMGDLFNQALRQVDVNPMMGFFLVTGAVAIVFNILADLAYSALDPRIRVTV
ncbi:MAG: ABC transporter permease, partial [Microbacterium sp.]|nr:ABC transporter permease [Microbacterium sp.]